MEFNNLEDLYSYIKKDISESLVEDVGEEVSEVLHEEIMNTYKEYEPWGSNPYVRRYDSYGGWGDRNMIETDIVQDTNSEIKIEVSNKSLGVGDDYGDYLSPIIEYGLYEWTHSEPEEDYSYSDTPTYLGGIPKDKPDKPPRRPAFARTRKRIENSTLVQNTLIKSLKNKGYTIK